jgi:hypothetical protein
MQNQLNANQPFDIGGPAQALMSRGAHFARGIGEGRGPGGGMPAAAGALGGAGEGAAGLGELAAEAAPLALAALDV